MNGRPVLVKSWLAALISCGAAFCQEAAPFVLEVPAVPLVSDAPTFVAVSTSGHTTCQVKVLTGGKTALESPVWGTEPDKPVGRQLGARLARSETGNYTVQMTMHPTSKETPRVSMVLAQGKNQQIEQLKNLARQASFIRDSIRPPHGHFSVNLSIDSSVQLQIWPGESAKGGPIYAKKFPNLPDGENTIPWDLTTRRGDLVSAGRYFGWLICTPISLQLHPTNIVSYFSVEPGR